MLVSDLQHLTDLHLGESGCVEVTDLVGLGIGGLDEIVDWVGHGLVVGGDEVGKDVRHFRTFLVNDETVCLIMFII